MANQRDIDRWKKGKDHWNKWAEGRLKAKEKLEKEGKWAIKDGGSPANSLTDRWMKSATVDFSDQIFEEHTDFSHLVFPSHSLFNRSQFKHSINFTGAVFHGFVEFLQVSFEYAVYFSDVNFKNDALFRKSAFIGITQFQNTKFEEYAGFGESAFADRVEFTGSIFEGNAGFSRTIFKDIAQFENTKFLNQAFFDGAEFFNAVIFDDAVFEGDSSFVESVFLGRVSFAGSNHTQSLSLESARFAEPPDFRKAELSINFQLDSVEFFRFSIFDTLKKFKLKELRPFTIDLLRRSFGIAENADAEEKWRELRRRANEVLDHDAELEAFAAETKSKRIWKWPIWRFDLYGMSYFYGAFSDFGRSLLRPILGWLLTVFFFAGYYGAQAPNGYTNACIWPRTRLVPELYLSFLHSLPIVGFGRGEKRDHALACLFGDKDNISPTIDMFFIAHNTFAAVLIFLFFLAVRNHFRIK